MPCFGHFNMFSYVAFILLIIFYFFLVEDSPQVFESCRAPNKTKLPKCSPLKKLELSEKSRTPVMCAMVFIALLLVGELTLVPQYLKIFSNTD